MTGRKSVPDRLANHAAVVAGAPADGRQSRFSASLPSLNSRTAPPVKPLADAVSGGFSRDFLSTRVELPRLSAANKSKAAKLNGSEVVPYTHFSLSLNTARRFAFWVAWNVDGSQLRKLSRTSISFKIDPRLPAGVQAGDELYSGNRLDRGHIARRADLLWGSAGEAAQANLDSFFFTNITPQMDDFNQSGLGGLWGKLEDAVFADTKVQNLKISVFGGPVFHDDDRESRGVRIPREFWKVIAFVEADKLKAKAFVLTQRLDGLRVLELDQFKVFQTALVEIESRCGITLAATLKRADSFGERVTRIAEAPGQRQPLRSLDDIDWS